MKGWETGGFNSLPLHQMDLTREDWERFAPEKPDPNYNVKKNRAVIDRTIKKYEKRRKLELYNFEQKLGERTDAVASYLKSNAAESGKPIEKYLGKRMLAQLRGEQIIDKLRMLSRPSFSMMDVVKNKPFTDMREVNAKKKAKSRRKKT